MFLRCTLASKHRATIIFAILFAPSAMAAGPLTYRGLQTTFEQECVRCHKAGRDRGGLRVDVFPFQSTRRRTLPDIGRVISGRIVGKIRPMPPRRMPDAVVSDIQKWIEIGMPAQ
jgi:hypothetical protein